jgi:aminopeptidase N
MPGKTKRMQTRTRTRTRTNKNKGCATRKLRLEDVDYATDIDVLTIMSKDKQRAALKKVDQFLKCNKSNEMVKRRKQILELIKSN